MVKGKYGYYPCDIETYRKLKAINFAYDKALHKRKEWERWERKDPQNRVIRKKIKDSTGRPIGYHESEPMPEPAICTVFSKIVVEKDMFDKNGKYYKEGFERQKVHMAASPYDDYRKARYPALSEYEVEPLSISLEEIDKLFKAIA